MATWYFDHGQALDICPPLVIEGPTNTSRPVLAHEVITLADQ